MLPALFFLQHVEILLSGYDESVESFYSLLKEMDLALFTRFAQSQGRVCYTLFLKRKSEGFEGEFLPLSCKFRTSKAFLIINFLHFYGKWDVIIEALGALLKNFALCVTLEHRLCKK